MPYAVTTFHNALLLKNIQIADTAFCLSVLLDVSEPF